MPGYRNRKVRGEEGCEIARGNIVVSMPKKKFLRKIKVRCRFYRYIYNVYTKTLRHILYLRYRFLRRLRFRYIRLLVYVGFRLWLKEIHNFEKLPQKGPVIIVSNHTSYYDWSVLSAVYNRKYVVFLGNKELLKRPIVSWLMKLNILIYIDTDYPGFSYFREVINRLRQGHIVVIYPEGRRSRTGKMIEPKIGFVKLAMITKVPIVPIGMKGTFGILPPHKKIPRFHKCEMFVGDPIKINRTNPLFKDIFLREKNSKKLNDEGMKEIAIRIMDGIAKMVGQDWDDSVRKN